VVAIGTNEDRTDIDFGFGKLCQGAIGDYVWHDLNRWHPDLGEHGIEGVEVQLVYTDAAGVEHVLRRTTDADMVLPL
jgi:hypothetical protein